MTAKANYDLRTDSERGDALILSLHGKITLADADRLFSDLQTAVANDIPRPFRLIWPGCSIWTAPVF